MKKLSKKNNNMCIVMENNNNNKPKLIYIYKYRFPMLKEIIFACNKWYFWMLIVIVILLTMSY